MAEKLKFGLEVCADRSRMHFYITCIAGAPLEISEDLVTTFNISLVVRGTISETSVDPKEQQAKEERYKAPKEAKIFRYRLFVHFCGLVGIGIGFDRLPAMFKNIAIFLISFHAC